MIFFKRLKLILLFLIFFPIVMMAQKKHVLSNPHPSKEAVALYSYINDLFGEKILSGQMCSTWGTDELKYIHEVTGKYPAIRGMDFIEADQNDSEVLRAIDWWKRGGIPTIMWHWGAPGIGEGYKNSLKQIDINKCFEKGTPENIAFWSELKKKADQLEKLKDANVPILWRPFHEFTGDWFWWSKQGPEQFKRLWKTMYNYFVNDRTLNNLIWVLCYTAKPDSAWYPGDKYVDIAGADNYKIGEDPGAEMYNAVKKIVGIRVPIAYHECGVPPNPEKCFEQGIMWSWFMEWHTDFIMKVDKDYLRHVYNNNLVVTLDEVPDIMKVYGKKSKWISNNLQSAARQYKLLIKNLPKGVMPESFVKNKLVTCNSKNWVAGFYPGNLLFLFEATHDSVFYKEAIKKIPLMTPEQYNSSTHDLGFMMYCSYGNLNRISPDEKYTEILLNSAHSLASRFNPKIGCIRSWGNSNDSSEFKVIIDNMMNLELLFWATKVSGDSSFYNIAVTHANTTMKNHFRADNSSYHVVIYDPQTGEVIKKQTAQGAADSSAWARGQSWGLYGFTMMYRETKNKKYLAQAEKIADFILNNPHLPADKIPYWDYDAPGIPNTYRDASAAAIMASALIELSHYSDSSLSKKYKHAAFEILQTLSSPQYRADIGENGGFILKHSVANMNANAEVDAPLPYADYYYLEALLRWDQ